MPAVERNVLAECEVTNEEALKRIVRSGVTVGTGFATSEPHTFYATVWDHIQREDLADITFRQALFMAPHALCLGNALGARGWLKGWAQHEGPLGAIANKTYQTTRKLDGLRRLIAHYEELKRRRVRFISGFLGPATNIVIPANLLTRTLYPDFAGRNTSRMGITDMQSIHFPNGVDAMAFDADKRPLVDTFACVATPPNEQGEMSFGPSNGVNTEAIARIIEDKTVNLLLYVNPKYPFTRGYGDAPNTFRVDDLRGLAESGRLLVVRDEGKIPSLPADSFKNPSEEEKAIAENVVNHIEMHRAYTQGRALQVGIGGTGVLAVKALKTSSWSGRCYTEMLEPFTLDLFESGKIAGSHFVEKDGRRTQLDGKMVCTFTLCEENCDFYQRLHNNPAIVMAAASRVVVSEAFHYGLGINNCLGIDFHGQVNSAGRDSNHHSGIGGGAVIARGLSRGGVGYFCLKSTHTTPDGELRSSLFDFLPRGTPISHVGPDLMGGREGARFFLVTEHGVAQVSGTSQGSFIKALISVADPRFKDWLKFEARRHFSVTF